MKRPICTNATRLPPSVDVLENQRRVYLTPRLCGVRYKKNLVLEMEDRVSFYLIIIIRLYITINELQRDVKQYSINQSFYSCWVKQNHILCRENEQTKCKTKMEHADWLKIALRAPNFKFCV